MREGGREGGRENGREGGGGEGGKGRGRERGRKGGREGGRVKLAVMIHVSHRHGICVLLCPHSRLFPFQAVPIPDCPHHMFIT